MVRRSNKTIDEYLYTYPKEIRDKLTSVRKVIKKTAFGAVETIKYGIPTFVLNGNLVHYAGYKNHIGFYPAPSAIQAFKRELSMYKISKGAVRFPIDQQLPLDLITKMVKFRVRENMEKG